MVINIKRFLILCFLLLFSNSSFSEEKFISVQPEDISPEWHCGGNFPGPTPDECFLVLIANGRVVKKIAVDKKEMIGREDEIVDKALVLMESPNTFDKIKFD